MSRYNVIQAIFMSFYSKDLYRDVAQRWGGKVFGYLFLLLALSWIGFTYSVQHSVNVFYATKGDKIVSQLPVMTVKDGNISTPENRPYFITDPDNNAKLAVIDTTGHFTNLEQAKTDILVTQNTVISKDHNEIKIYQVPSSINEVVDPKVIDNFLQKFINFIWLLFFVFVLIFSYIYRILQAILYSIIGKVYASAIHAPVSFFQVMQIAMVAVTPAIVIDTILNFANNFSTVASGSINSSSWILLIYFVLSMFYMFYGIRANKV